MSYRIVAGLDGSVHSGAALRWAVAEAAARGGSVTALCCWQQPLLAPPGSLDPASQRETAAAFARDQVAALAPRPAAGITAATAQGDPARCLIDASRHADLLVLGIRGRSPAAGQLIGSVSQRCAAGAHCPVVLVKLGDSVS